MKPAKHVMTEELDSFSNVKSFFLPGVFVDFMSVVRRAPLQKMHMFSKVLQFLWNSYTKVRKAGQVDFILDSYMENSIKEGERQRRSAKGAPLQFLQLEKTTPVPVRIERFWSC